MPGTPSRRSGKGQSERKKGSGDWEGEHNEAKRKAGKKALQIQTGMGQEYICFFDAEDLRQRARKGKKGF